ncbi:metallophosphoesterase family protein [Zavarzinella formosa]|uniref:metallophosphoesterase family protein n=1 Tax=Zavarzinella formosa TaxID=360055 RepID=UPI00030D4001|nr:exonuclease subunit SbcD [Zavarzinella formosa]
MRILHTADWHLGDRLGRIDRTEDLRRAVERVGMICDNHSVDVLLVAGDLFSELARPDNLRETIEHWQQVFGGFLREGGTILTLTGNHDNENFCRTLGNAMNLASPSVGHMGDVVPGGRLHLATEPTLLKLADRHGGYHVQFILMPYPTPSRYFRDDPAPKYAGPDEKNARLMDAFLEELRRIQRHERFDRRLPTVLGAHINVHGATVGPTLFRIAESDDVVFRPEDLPDEFAYVALGHVHKEQTLGGRENLRYSGSIEKMDLGESGDHKSVTLLEINETGLAGLPQLVPLPSTPVVSIVLDHPTANMEVLRERYPEPCDDLVNLDIRYTAGVDSLEEILIELDKMFPRWYARNWRETGELTDRLATEENTPRGASFEETVRDYVRRELQNHSDEEREEILWRLDKLFKVE